MGRRPTFEQVRDVFVTPGDEFVSEPERGTEQYKRLPFCGNAGCDCPPFAELDRILEKLTR